MECGYQVGVQVLHLKDDKKKKTAMDQETSVGKHLHL
jgi:hypothetical protein